MQTINRSVALMERRIQTTVYLEELCARAMVLFESYILEHAVSVHNSVATQE